MERIYSNICMCIRKFDVTKHSGYIKLANIYYVQNLKFWKNAVFFMLGFLTRKWLIFHCNDLKEPKQVWKHLWWSDLFVQWIFCEKEMVDHQRHQRMMANNILCALLHTTVAFLLLLSIFGYSNVSAIELKSLRKY